MVKIYSGFSEENRLQATSLQAGRWVRNTLQNTSKEVWSITLVWFQLNLEKRVSHIEDINFILSLKPMFLTNDRIKSRKDNYLAPNQIVDSSFFLNHNSTFIVFPFRKV